MFESRKINKADSLNIPKCVKVLWADKNKNTIFFIHIWNAHNTVSQLTRLVAKCRLYRRPRTSRRARSHCTTAVGRSFTAVTQDALRNKTFAFPTAAKRGATFDQPASFSTILVGGISSFRLHNGTIIMLMLIIYCLLIDW